MMDYEWKSALAPMIVKYLDMKHMAGFKYEAQERCLRHFDHYYYYSGYDDVSFTKHSITPFLYRQDESLSTRCRKETLIIDFAHFLNDRGYKAYVPGRKHVWKRSAYIPHIYTKDERIRFLQAVDTYPSGHGLYRELVDPVLFRILIATGCRLSEALFLRISDYRKDTGTIIIRRSKNGSSRIVPVCASLQARICSYIDSFHNGKDANSLLFPGNKNGKPLDKSTVYLRFRDYLLMADIPHTASGPRIHDWRHTAAVENLRRWSEQGKDLTELLPYLSAFMGHTDFRATQYYLRLTAEIYPHLVEKMEDACWYIIPEGGFRNEE